MWNFSAGATSPSIDTNTISFGRSGASAARGRPIERCAHRPSRHDLSGNCQRLRSVSELLQRVLAYKGQFAERRPAFAHGSQELFCNELAAFVIASVWEMTAQLLEDHIHVACARSSISLTVDSSENRMIQNVTCRDYHFLPKTGTEPASWLLL
jgi:hypothetical protein